jgi:isopentenyl diphosphate isomerase/L-lactate dehydrogenase-like FMN-dependent dehydrogenase
LKLDNAALRAENVLLKRQLTFFEDLFAKKASGTSTQSIADNSSKPSSRKGMSDDETYSKDMYNVKKRGVKHISEDMYSMTSGDNEANEAVKHGSSE